MYFQLRESDLGDIVNRTPKIWETLRGSRILITGGTGFFGRWVLGSLLCANKVLDTRIDIVVMSRDPERFLVQFPEANVPYLEFFEGDIRNCEFPDEEFQSILHMATDSVFAYDETHLQLADSILFGTRRLLDHAVRCAKADRFLFVSTGAVYGSHTDSISPINENIQLAPSPSDPQSLIGNTKRSAEQMCTLFHQQFNLQTKIARCFSFLGSHLPMEGYFAIGNFIHNALFEEAIQVIGDGTPVRSYLYAADLAVWLLTILVNGRPNYPYNVGSDRPIAMKELAELVARTVAPEKPIQITNSDLKQPARQYYVPSIHRARDELKLDIWTPLHIAITHTAEWYAKNSLQEAK
jgi:dTDP-glucose 4,6-dehydratase